MAEKDLIKAIDALKKQNETYYGDQMTVANTISSNTQDTKDILTDLLKEFKGSREEAREAQIDAARSGGANPPPRRGGDREDPEFELKGILQTLAGIAAAATGFAIGLAEGLGRIYKGILTAFAKFLKLDKLVAPIRNLGRFINTQLINVGRNIRALVRAAVLSFSISFPQLTNTILNFGDRIKGLSDGARGSFSNAVTRVTKQFTSTFKNLQNAFLAGTNGVQGVARTAQGTFRQLNTIEKFMRTWGRITGQISDGAKFIGRVLNDRIARPFRNLMNGIRGVGQSTSVLGRSLQTLFTGFRTIGRFVAFPLTIIMSIIDGFKGLKAGMERQEGTFNKIIGGVLGAIGGVIKGLIMVPLDLVKDLISWIAGKLGFDNFAKSLDSFSFADQFQAFVNRLTDGFVALFVDFSNRVIEPFKEGFSLGALLEVLAKLPGTIFGGIMDFFKNIVSSVLSFFGATDAANFLDSFRMTEQFDKVINGIAGLVTNIFDSITSFFMDTFGSLYNNFIDIFTGGSEKPILERIYTFLKDFITSAVTWPYDLIKNVVSGIVGFFGFEEAQQSLDSFSFKDTFGQIIDYVFNLPSMLADKLFSMLEGTAVGDAIGEAMSTVTDFAERFQEWMKGIIRPYLQDLATDESWMGSIGKFVVPKEAFAWAGVNPDTGEMTAPVVSAPETTRMTNAGEEVTTKSKENAQASASAPIMVNAPMQSNSTVNNNSTTAAVIDQNLPTVDYNDSRNRGNNLTWQGGVGLV